MNRTHQKSSERESLERERWEFGEEHEDKGYRHLADNTTHFYCKPQHVIEKFLNSSYLSLYFMDYIVDTANYTSPFSVVGRDNFWQVSMNAYKDIQVFFRNVYIETDKGWIFPELETISKPLFSYYRDSSSFEKQHVYARLFLRLEKQRESYYF